MNSLKTTLMGILTILITIAVVAKKFLSGLPIDSTDIGSVIAAVTAGIGLIAARDNTVTSEEALAPSE
jgi:hypothetical protein